MKNKIILIMIILISIVIAILAAVVVVIVIPLSAVEEKDYMDELIQGDIWVNESGQLVIVRKDKVIA